MTAGKEEVAMDTKSPLPVSDGPAEPDRLIRFTEARETLGLSKSTMYRLIERNALPRPVKIGALTFFSQRELQSWIAEKLAGRGRELGDE